jgi:hypothetical protein
MYLELPFLAAMASSSGDETSAYFICRWRLWPVVHSEGFVRYSGAAGAEFAHEAGFDAYMTGAVFSQLAVLVAANQVLQEAGLFHIPKKKALPNNSMLAHLLHCV